MSPDAPQLLPARSLEGLLPGVRAGFSTALPRLDDAALAPRLRDLVAASWGVPPRGMPAPLLLRQTHSTAVLHLDGATDAPQGSPAFDGAAAPAESPWFLVVKAADCVPLLAVETGLRRYAALHAGWRGAAGGILPALLVAWRLAGGRAEDVHLELGPHIRACCYEVGADCLAQFAPELLRGAVQERGGRTYLDLAAVLAAQAGAAGVPAAGVVTSVLCTYCHRDEANAAPFASYRRAAHTCTAYDRTNVGLIGCPD